jgi:beta-glucosidase-like glycosyl hydrolase
MACLCVAVTDNAVNGVPSCANDWLLNTVAREEWLFDGYVTSDVRKYSSCS